MHRNRSGVCLSTGILIIGFVFFWGGKGGLKRRLDDGEHAEAAQIQDSRAGSSADGRGGIRHRISDADAGQNPNGKPETKGPLVDWLKTQWAKGKLSTVQLQQAAMNAELQGTPNIHGMAALGNFGANPQNLFRAMKNLVGWPENCAPHVFHRAPYKTRAAHSTSCAVAAPFF